MAPNQSTSRRKRTATLPNLSWGIGALLLLIALTVAGILWFKSQIGRTGFTAGTAVKQIVIGNDVLAIPANLLRFPNHREANTLDEANLALLWPNGTGYSLDNAAAFQQLGARNQIVFISLSKRKMQFDMNSRLKPIYSILFDGSSTLGPAGLRMQPLKQSKGYDGEQLAIYDNPPQLWVARCHYEDASAQPSCQRDVFVGKELSLRYRFPLHLLPQWREIEMLVVGKIEAMLVR